MTDLRPGWTIVGNDGHLLGTIRTVGQNYLVASRTGLAREIYVPASHIANVENEVVYLNLPKAAAQEMGWEQPPREEDAPETTPEADLHRHI
jgi:hypothetical protein